MHKDGVKEWGLF